MNRSRRAFTLLELTLVLMLLAVASATAMLHIRGRIQHETMNDVVGRVQSFDRLTRACSRQQDKTFCTMVSPSSGRFMQVDPTTFRASGTELQLPEEFSIAEVRIAGKPSTTADTAIVCSRLGLTPSYAVKIADRSGAGRWVLVAGLSGQSQEIDDERDVQGILATTRNDAD